MRTRLVICNITSSHCVMLSLLLLLFSPGACNIQLHNLTRASHRDVNAVKALICPIWVGKMSRYPHPVHSVPLSEGKHSLWQKTKLHKATLIITQKRHKMSGQSDATFLWKALSEKNLSSNRKKFLKFTPWETPFPSLSKTWSQFIDLLNEITNLFIGIISFS